MQTHYFLAVSLPPLVKDTLSEWIEQQKHKLSFQSWVHRDDYHITLAFLGNADPLILPALQDEMEKLASYFASFSLTLQGLHTFGATERPRILWAGVTETKELFALQQDVHRFCTTHGFSLETRPYRPHITLARRWKSEADLAADMLPNLETDALHSLSFSVGKIGLYKTNLDRTPKYEEVYSVVLRK
ncbi:RNA 2',3'-cyclic phosphodiesterase [Microbacteriaceae bacterium 4G12]